MGLVLGDFSFFRVVLGRLLFTVGSVLGFIMVGIVKDSE